MEKDERLLPLPNANDLQLTNQETPVNYSPFYDDDTFNEGRSIRDYFLVIYKRLPLILAMTIAVTALVAFYMYRQPLIYQAQTTLIMEVPKAKATAKDSININFGYDPNYYNTQLSLLSSSDLMKEVVLRLGLQRDPNLFNQSNKGFLSSLRAIISRDSSAQPTESSLPVLSETSVNINQADATTLTPEEQQRVELYAGYLSGNLTAEQVKETNIVNVRVQNTNPELAAKVADTVANAFIELNAKRAVQGAENAYQELSKSIEELKSSINQQEQERINYMRASGLPLTNEKGNDLNAVRLQALSTNWIAGEDERRKLQAQYEAAVAARNKGEAYAIPEIIKNEAIQAARRLNSERSAKLEEQIQSIDKEIQVAEAKYSQLMVKYQPEYVEAQIVAKQIERLKEFREKTQREVSQRINEDSKKLEQSSLNEVLTGMQAQLAAAQRREGQLKNLYLNEIRSANQQGVASTRLTTLSNEIETNRSLLSTYIQRQKEMELAISSGRPDNISISSKAQTPISPIGPQRNRNIIIAFLLSLAAGIGLAFLLDYLDDSVKTSDDIGRHLGLPTLALIPHQSILDKRKRLTTGKNGNASSTALISIEDSRSAMAEAYRHLRTSLLFSSAGKPPQTILVTSSQPSEGKTTTAINTAITLAQAGADVVIIDCDLRRPRLHNHFGLENTSGLTNYLSGEKNPENLLKPYPALPKLKVVTSGPIPPNPAELLSSNEMKNLLQYLKGNFNHVIVDSPPAISFTDAAILSTLVDGVVLVAMSGKSSIHLIRRFKQRLNTLGARIYGVVLNGIKPDSFEYGYGYGYAYAYDYYDTPDDDDTTPRMGEDFPVHTAAKNKSAKADAKVE